MKHTFLATILAMLFALSFVSCDKDDETTITRDLCLYVNASKYDIVFGKPQSIVIHSGKQLEIDGFNKQSLDTMYMNVKLFYGDMATDNGYIISIEDYAWPTTALDEEIIEGVLMRTHKFEFTDALLDDIIAKMATKGISPQKGSWFTSDF